MPTPIPTVFSSYTLSEEEELHGQTFTNLNIAVLQNIRCQAAQDKLNLDFTPNDVLTYSQKEAYLKGQLDLIQYLMDLNDAAKQTRITLNQQP